MAGAEGPGNGGRVLVSFRVLSLSSLNPPTSKIFRDRVTSIGGDGGAKGKEGL